MDVDNLTRAIQFCRQDAVIAAAKRLGIHTATLVVSTHPIQKAGVSLAFLLWTRTDPSHLVSDQMHDLWAISYFIAVGSSIQAESDGTGAAVAWFEEGMLVNCKTCA